MRRNDVEGEGRSLLRAGLVRQRSNAAEGMREAMHRSSGGEGGRKAGRNRLQEK